MESVATDTVKHKKARAAREGFDARAMSPAKALRVALGKAADNALGLALTVSTVEQTRVPQAEVAKVLAGPGLTCLVEDDRGRRGTMQLDFSALGAVIEIQTIGRVSDRSVAERRLTRTDAALSAPFLDEVFATFEAGASELPDGDSWQGYRFGAMAEDIHSLTLALEAEEYHHFRIGLALGEPQRAGMCQLLLPVAGPPPAEADKRGSAAKDGADLSPVVMGAPVALQAILARHSISLEKALSLQPGDQLMIPGGGGMVLRLEAPGGHLVSEGRLGQVNGMRAVRLRGHARRAEPGPPPKSSKPPEQPRRAPKPATPAAKGDGTSDGALSVHKTVKELE